MMLINGKRRPGTLIQDEVVWNQRLGVPRVSWQGQSLSSNKISYIRYQYNVITSGHNTAILNGMFVRVLNMRNFTKRL